MKKLVVIAVMLISSSSPAYAGTFAEIVKFAGGVTTALLIHEGGHAAAAALTGTDLDWHIDKTGMHCSKREPVHDDTGLAISAAGLITQAIAGELILRSDVDKDDNFWRGMMFWNIWRPIHYALDYWIFHDTNKIGDWGYQGDIAGIEYCSSKSIANGFSVAICAIAASQGYRFIKTQSWAPAWIRESPVEVAAYPVRSGGGLVCKIDF